LLAAWLIREYGVAQGFSGFGGYLVVLFLIAALAIRQLNHQAFSGWGQRA
jgi:hypothetical protein